MTQEEKAKRYDELLLKLQKAKVDDNVCDERYCCVIDDIVPELQEDDDEKIRKGIIRNLEYLLDSAEGFVKDELKERIVWLEKQGEQVSAIRWYDASFIPQEMKELLVEWNSSDATWHDVAFYHANTKTFLNYERELKNVTRWCYVEDLFEEQSNVKETGISQHDKKTCVEWSEEDSSKVQRICKYLDEAKKYYADITEVRECIDWLKSLKDRVKTQQEWTMQDEEELQIALDTLAKAGQHSSAKWLKNVCLVPQNKWKPSEEQMKELNYAVNAMASSRFVRENACCYNVLKSLQKQLRKLKGE